MNEKCRVCLSTNSLYSWKSVVAGKLSYADLFYRITGLKKKPIRNKIQSKQLQGYFCKECKDQIYGMYKFIERAIAADVHFSSRQTPIKPQNIEHFSIEITPLRKEKTQARRLQNELAEENHLNNEKEEDEGSDKEWLETRTEDLQIELADCDKYADNYMEVDVTNDVFEVDPIEEDVADKVAHESRHICEYCGKSFKAKSAKKRHMLSLCPKRLICDACPRTFKDVWSLGKHKKTHDINRSRNFICSQCGLRFLTSDSLKGHQDIHNDKREKQFSCDQCDKAFFQRGALNVHRRIHTGDLVKCKFCDKRYPRLVDLKIHMRSHTGEFPFKCATCGKTFKYGSTLYTHVRKVHFGFIYKCSYCSKQYDDKQALIEHKKLHQNIKFKCLLCDKELAKKYPLKCHIKSVHGIENLAELEDLIITYKAERQHRTMRNFSSIQYEKHIDLQQGNSLLTFRQMKLRRNENI